jgi:pyruvate ferredoxin oxidoreductase alpha subunit
MRLPFVLTGVNRTITAPISIQCDHQDTISLRDSGVIQIYVESSQEAYDTHIAAFKIAEDPKILLPVMVCMDGWVLTHSYERISPLAQEAVDRFLPPFKPANCLDVRDPKSWGCYAEEDNNMEFKYALQAAMQYSKGRIKEIFSELTNLSGRDHGGLVETYRTKDADVILLGMGTVAGTAKEAVDELRERGKKVGLVKIRCYRPFPAEDIWEAVKGARVVGVMEANFSMGSEGAVGMDLKAKLCGRADAPLVVDFIVGLAGRAVNTKTIGNVVQKAEDVLQAGHPLTESHWMDLNTAILP